MDLTALGIAVTSKRDAGSLVQYSFGLPQGSEVEALSALLAHMLDGCELSVPDPTNADCALEAWRTATLEEAHAWLLPGALAAVRLARPGLGAMLVVPKGGNDG